MEDQNPAAIAEHAAAAAPHYNAAASLKLSPFWSDTPATWFAMAECQFHLRRITDEQDPFCILVAALSKIRLVTNIIEDPPQNPYTKLKAVLLKSNQLTDFQRVENLHQLEPLRRRKPSELLAIMLEICPRGQDTSLFFRYLFLQRLPSRVHHIRVFFE